MAEKLKLKDFVDLLKHPGSILVSIILLIIYLNTQFVEFRIALENNTDAVRILTTDYKNMKTLMNSKEDKSDFKAVINKVQNEIAKKVSRTNFDQTTVRNAQKHASFSNQIFEIVQGLALKNNPRSRK